ncbi:MAG: cytochrome P450 [Reyranella sp.]|uniref:cytochrome P450 n=1 Tax=Reyranella sp. TaxID=1929291 RepID=UPI00120FE6AC|nr:cytochrome P450 [Reyranella sp.]TAJ97834.1 MAG: cytochrome P450 [Reyranella sp.]TBR27707.1 MAG: cytochrome P450 [Reyranella sp.]
MHETNVDLFDPGYLANPYPTLKQLREERPVYWDDQVKGWVVTRHADVKNILGRANDFSNSRIRPFLDYMRRQGMNELAEVGESVTEWVVFLDKPPHTKVRMVLNQAFLPAIPGMESFVREKVNKLLDDLEGRERFNLLDDYAVPLPTAVIVAMFGLPPEHAEMIKHWSDELAAFIGGARLDPKRAERSTEAIREMRKYFAAVIEDRKKNRGTDVISCMINYSEKLPEPFTDEQYLQTCTILIFAGHETTTDLIGTGIYNLLRNPDQIKVLREHPEYVDNAIEELLRFDNPAACLVRVSMVDTEIGGQQIKQGDRLFCMILATNRDPSVFAEPDKLDVTRKPKGSLHFGYGVHLCLGAPLARLEGRIAITEFLKRYSGVQLTDTPPPWREAYVVRGVSSLELRNPRAIAAG